MKNSLVSSVLMTFVLSISLVALTGCDFQLLHQGERIDVLQSEIKVLKDEVTALKQYAQQQEALKIQAEEIAAKQKHFDDLDDKLSTTPMIKDLANLGVFNDMPDEFKPYEKITRAEYVTWLFNAHNAMAKTAEDKIQLAPSFNAGFTDMTKDHPAYPYVAAMANAGYSVGYSDKTFKPENPITREEMIVMKVGVDMGKTYGADAAQMATIWKFSDADKIDASATGYILADFYVDNSNLLRAFGKVGTFHPKQAVLRHEAAATLWQFGQFPTISETNATYALKRQDKLNS